MSAKALSIKVYIFETRKAWPCNKKYLVVKEKYLDISLFQEIIEKSV